MSAGNAASLSAAQLEALTKRLSGLKAAAVASLRKSQGELRGEDAELLADLSRTGDWAVAEAEFERDVASAEQARRAIGDVLAAESRLRAGTYGQCVSCGTGIVFERLSAQPAAARCVVCQQTAESRAPGR